MDFNLPDIDGRTLSLLLKQQLKQVPIVACTARVGDVELQIAARFGCSAVLNKPFTPGELLTVVEKTLKNQVTMR
jgi:CheY-like chemotaxis protein